jgi:hypothetical protein
MGDMVAVGKKVTIRYRNKVYCVEAVSIDKVKSQMKGRTVFFMRNSGTGDSYCP